MYKVVRPVTGGRMTQTGTTGGFLYGEKLVSIQVTNVIHVRKTHL